VERALTNAGGCWLPRIAVAWRRNCMARVRNERVLRNSSAYGDFLAEGFLYGCLGIWGVARSFNSLPACASPCQPFILTNGSFWGAAYRYFSLLTPQRVRHISIKDARACVSLPSGCGSWLRDFGVACGGTRPACPDRVWLTFSAVALTLKVVASRFRSCLRRNASGMP